MPPAPAGAEIVGKISDQRIAKSIEDERQKNGQTGQTGIQPHHRAVEEHQEIVVALVFHAVGDSAKSVGQFGSQTQRRNVAGRLAGCGCHQNCCGRVGSHHLAA